MLLVDGNVQRRNAHARANIERSPANLNAPSTFMKILSPQRAWAGTLILFLLPGFGATIRAQDPTSIEDDPIKLFERGQDAHARNDYKTAIEFYDAAIRLKPEFPEAEFQRALALLFSNQKDDALKGFNRAVELRPDWSFAYARFGSQLAAYFNDDHNAEPILRRAIELDPENQEALIALADMRARAGDSHEALRLVKIATSAKGATASTWRKRAIIEAGSGDRTAAMASLDRALTLDPNDLGATDQRAKLLLEVGDKVRALRDIQVLEKAGHGSDLAGAFELAQLYDRAGRRDEAIRILDALSEKDRKIAEVVALRAELAGGDGSSPEERAALELMLESDPKNAALLAKLGAAYRRVDPGKSLDYYYRSLLIEPANAKYAVGYAAALNQARRFPEAVPILRAVIARNPTEYLAHANLALALFELKDFRSAISEYEWIAGARPEVAPTYFFLAVAHDNLQEYPEALDAYEKFLARADATTNKLEIDKVNLRLPILRDQIKRGQGKRKPS
jgi:tetratricopeptide (TPR) repeat protein